MIYKAVFHVDLDEDKPFALGLTNITNMLKAIPGRPYDLVMLFNGPGVTLLEQERCVQYREQIQMLRKAEVSFQVCGNALERFEVETEDLIKYIEIVPAGIVKLIELQHAGYAYIKP